MLIIPCWIAKQQTRMNANFPPRPPWASEASLAWHKQEKGISKSLFCFLRASINVSKMYITYNMPRSSIRASMFVCVLAWDETARKGYIASYNQHFGCFSRTSIVWPDMIHDTQFITTHFANSHGRLLHEMVARTELRRANPTIYTSCKCQANNKWERKSSKSWWRTDERMRTKRPWASNKTIGMCIACFVSAVKLRAGAQRKPR